MSIRQAIITTGAAALVSIGAALTPTPGEAQATTTGGSNAGPASTTQTIDIVNQQANNASLFSFDYGIPTSPALTLAGLSPDKTTTSTSLKPFVLALPGLIDSASGQSSAALDMSAAWLLGAQGNAPTTFYQDDYLTRLGFRTRVGLALYRGVAAGTDPSNAKPSRAAIGFSTSLLDMSDPVMATSDPLAGATENTKTGRWNSVWDMCLDAPGDQMKPFIEDQDNKRTIISRDESILTGYLSDIGGDTIGSLQDVDSRLSTADQANIRTIEVHLNQIAGDSTIPGADAAFTRGRLSADAHAADNYIKIKSPNEITYDQKTTAFIQGCQKKASEAAQHNADLEIGAGVVWSGISGQWADFQNPNVAAWIAGRYPLDFGARNTTDCGDNDNRPVGERIISCWMIGGSGRYSNGEMDATGNSTTPEFKANVAEGWIGIERIDSNSKFGGYFGYQDQRAADSMDKAFSKSGTRWLVSGAYSLGFLEDGLWIEGSYGAADGTVSTLNDKVALLTLTFGPPKIGSGFVSSDTSDATASATPNNAAGANPNAGGNH